MVSRARRVVGVFAAQMDDAYQIAVWRGIESRARQRGMGVVSFVGHRIGSPVASEAAANIVYRIAHRRNIDGLIVVSSAIATFLSPREIKQLFVERGDMPQVSLGLAVPGVPSITASGHAGVAAIVEHLVRNHGRARFAMIRGPAGHPEAEDRERAFRDTLRRLSVPFDEDMAAPGSFMRESGAEAARRLLRQGAPFDALVCMNDRMAIGAMEVLRQAGTRVPEDVSVVGFDGIEEGRYLTPPLTTVMQPLDHLGSQAVDLLESLMEGETPDDLVLTCTPVIRQSCGCLPRHGCDTEIAPPTLEATAAEMRAIGELRSLARSGDAEGFVARLSGALDATVLAGGEPSRWNDYLSAVRHGAGAGERAVGNARADGRGTLFEIARVLVGEAESRLQAARRVAAEERLATLRSISTSLAGAFEVPAMLERLETGLTRLGIGGGYIALFDGTPPDPEWSRLVMSPREPRSRTQDSEGAVHPPEGVRFRTRSLLPLPARGSWRLRSWVLKPLVFQSEPLGYMLLPGGAEEPAVYDTLSEQVSSALKGAILLQQVRSHERGLQVEVERRTLELTRANSELTLEIQRRMRLEQEVLDISNHTMQRIGQDLHDDLCQHLAGIAMLTSVLHGILAESDPRALSAIEQISDLLADSIGRAKQIARGLYPAGLEEHGIVAAVDELVDSVRRSYPVIVDFRASPDFRLSGTDQALQIYRIVQEALTNALKHSDSDRIEVRLYREHGGDGRHSACVAEVTDFGIGIPPSIPEAGMGLRIMRYRAETAGAELRIEKLDPGTRVSCRVPGWNGESA